MPTYPDLTTTDTVAPQEPNGLAPQQQSTGHSSDPGAESAELPGRGTDLLESIQHQVALFARRAEQTRLGGVGQARNSMDRAAYLLLNRLEQDGPTGVKALAAAMGIDSSTVTRQVAPLVDSGLVKRTSHPADGRAVVLELSPRGAHRLSEVRASRRDLMALLTKEWTPEEREVFCGLLTRFNRGLAEVHAPFGPRDGSAS
ncbi:MarR family transcriptional regulator [Streptomyces sp. P38-E01]|uniref:MarR family transcriptional regulator n=1 Tax=Streptomyces tardus TaxID=2780544 RepID=A0A949JM39_9ACTN|nr:MarR family transcriptional regulator [Streptomyces tardus]